eukprot:COSAG02_NODE_16254_length_1099_cov_1.086000_1_plen_84_part_10
MSWDRFEIDSKVTMQDLMDSCELLMSSHTDNFQCSLIHCLECLGCFARCGWQRPPTLYCVSVRYASIPVLRREGPSERPDVQPE